MTGIYHTNIVAGSAANAATLNAPLEQLDAAMVTAVAVTAGVAVTAAAVTAEVDAARGGYGDLNSRLAMLAAAGGSILTAVNGVHNAGWTEVVVDSSTGFIAMSYVVYALVGGILEYNLVADIHSPTQLTLTTPIGTGGIADNAVIAMISASEYAAATVIPHGGTYVPTLPATMEIASQGIYNVLAYGSDAEAPLLAAIADIDTTPATLLISAGVTVAADLTIPATLTLKILQGGTITVNTGISLTTGSPEAGLYQIFNCLGTGKVGFGAGKVLEIYPQWWGAKGNGTTDDTAAIQAAIDAMPLGVSINNSTKKTGKLVLPSGKYKISTSLKLRAGMVLEGSGVDSTVIYNSTTTLDSIQCDPTISGSGRRIAIRNLTIQGNASATAGCGINIDDTIGGGSSFILENIVVYGHFNGFRWHDSVVSEIIHCIAFYCSNDGFVSQAYMNATNLIGCYAVHCVHYGYNIDSPTYCTFTGCASDENEVGYYIAGATNCTFTSCGAEVNRVASIWLYDCRFVTFTTVDLWIADYTDSDAFVLDSCEHIVFTNCYTQPHTGANVTGYSVRMVATLATTFNVTQIGGYMAAMDTGAFSSYVNVTSINSAAGGSGMSVGQASSGYPLGVTLPNAKEILGQFARAGVSTWYQVITSAGIGFKIGTNYPFIAHYDAPDGACLVGATYTRVAALRVVGAAGFNNTAPLAEPVLATGASHTVDDVITVLQNYGLVKQT